MKIRNSPGLVTIFSLAALIAGGCAHTTRHGDVTLTPGSMGWPIGLAVVGYLTFPDIPIGTKATYSFKVIDLPEVIYPEEFELKVPEAERIPIHPRGPWVDCVIQASLMTLDGRTFYTRTLRFNNAQGGGEAHWRRITISLPFRPTDRFGETALPKYRSYILKVDVLNPSSRVSDKVAVRAFTEYGIPSASR